VSSRNQRLLEAEWDRCRWVWNACVAAQRDARAVGATVGGVCGLSRLLTGWRAEQEWLAAGSSVAQQQTTRAFNLAVTASFRARLTGRRVGDPGFKKRARSRPTFEYTLRGFKLDAAGHLVLAGGIVLRPVWSRELPGAPSSVRVSRDSLGHWNASFVVDHDIEPLPCTGRDLGIDWGVKAVATTSDPLFDLPHSEHGRKAAARLARYQRQMARRKPKPGMTASQGYKTAKRQVAKAHYTVAEQRKDEARKWAHRVVVAHDRIAVEDFKPTFLAKSRMARKAADGRIASARSALADAVERHGRELVTVPAAFTTMECSCCGARAKHRLPLSQRTYRCEACGYTAGRDYNAASNMLARAGFNPAGADRVRPEQPRVARAA
jgi:putative transposase